MFLWGLLLVVTLICGSSAEILESDFVTNWGEWGRWDKCPKGSFVYGMLLKTERNDSQAGGWDLMFDDSSLNAINLFCKEPGGAEVRQIMSTQGPKGNWGKRFECPQEGFMNGFQLSAESPQGGQKANPGLSKYTKDDTAANNLMMYCIGSKEGIKGDGTSWGKWGSVKKCAEGEAICGIQTQVEAYTKQGWEITLGDYTGLNNVRMECCKVEVKSEAETCRPRDEWVTKVDCDARESTITECTFKKELGVTKTDGSTVEKSEITNLIENFNKNLAPSSNTGVNWPTDVDALTFGPYQFRDGATIKAVPALRKVYQYLVGICGPYRMYPMVLQQLIYDAQGVLVETKRGL